MMELIYAYIGKYRTFENQEISFSDKFRISYDDQKKNLSIKRNPDYFDLYPGNIVGVSAILGKNAAGKSSLLDLIGEKIEDRKEKSEILKRERRNPHKRIDILHPDISSDSGVPDFGEVDAYKNYYFLIYYYGKDGNDQDLYIFESDAPYLYINIFSRHKWYKDLNYYASKEWISLMFLSNEEHNEILGDTQDYRINGESIQGDTSVIKFLRRKYQNVFDRERSNREETSIISVRRRYTSLHNLYLYKQLGFLIKNMREKSGTVKMYSDEYYTINVSFWDEDTNVDELKSNKYDVSSVIPDYRDFISDDMSNYEKTLLAILWKYTWFIFRAIMHPGDKLTRKDPRNKILSKLFQKNTLQPGNDYPRMKDLYNEKIRVLLENDPDRDFIDATFSDIKRAVEALERFFKNADICNIPYIYTGDFLSFRIRKDTELDCEAHSITSFFDDFLDEPVKKNMEQEDSLLGGFFKTDIQFLSDGEKENLSMFTSLDEQISENLPEKKKYILLFDEIERSMHPEMCRNLLPDLMTFLQQRHPDKEFQIIIASHSPFIASDIRKENVVLLKRDGEKSIVSKPEQSPFAQNIHTILRSQFFLDSTFGAYAGTVMEELEKWLTSDQIDSTVTEKINVFLQGDTTNHKYEKTYLTSTEETIRFLQQMIDTIGEPVLKNYFQRLLNRHKKKPAGREALIQYYKKQLEVLEREEENSRD